MLLSKAWPSVQLSGQSKVTTKVKSAEIWVKTQRPLLNHQESDVRPGCSANPQTTALGGKYRQHLGAFPRVCGFKGTWGIGNRWTANLTWQCYRVGGHSRQFPLPSALRSTQLHYRRRLRIVLLCECSHQGGRDGERLMRGGGAAGRGEGVSRRTTCCNGLSSLHFVRLTGDGFLNFLYCILWTWFKADQSEDFSRV